MFGRANTFVLLALFFLQGAVQPVSAALNPEPYKERLLRLYSETFQSELHLDPVSATTHHVVYEGRPLAITLWRGRTHKGAALAFVAPADDSVVGVINLDHETIEVWQLRGDAADAPLDANVVNFPVSQRSHIGVADFVCAGVGGTIVSLACGVSLVCSVTGGVVVTGVCAGSHERTGRLQWSYKEDDPTGSRQAYVQYTTNWPYEGVHYDIENRLCVASANVIDYNCYRPQVTMDVHYVNYRTKVRWSDGSRTTVQFGSPRWLIHPEIIWHQSGYLPDLVPTTIEVRTQQQFVDPATGQTEWLYVDSVLAYTTTLSP